jgi:hypothetical protein
MSFQSLPCILLLAHTLPLHRLSCVFSACVLFPSRFQHTFTELIIRVQAAWLGASGHCFNAGVLVYELCWKRRASLAKSSLLSRFVTTALRTSACVVPFPVFPTICTDVLFISWYHRQALFDFFFVCRFRRLISPLFLAVIIYFVAVSTITAGYINGSSSSLFVREAFDTPHCCLVLTAFRCSQTSAAAGLIYIYSSWVLILYCAFSLPLSSLRRLSTLNFVRVSFPSSPCFPTAPSAPSLHVRDEFTTRCAHLYTSESDCALSSAVNTPPRPRRRRGREK